MADSAHSTDVLLYVNSHHILRTLPPDAENAAIEGLSQAGTYTFVGVAGAARLGAGGPALVGGNRTAARPIEGHELTADEQAAVDLVWKMIHECGKTLHIVDVGKQSGLLRYLEDHRHHLREFPVLLRPDGRRLEGCTQFTAEKLRAFLTD
jgi:hypothetical protein